MKRFLILCVVVCLSVPGTVLSRIWQVYPDGSGDAATIQAGIDSAAAADTVLLAGSAGDWLFQGPGNRDIDFQGKSITVRSLHLGGYPDRCWIECDGSAEDPHRGFHFHSGEGASAVLDGVGIRGGYSDFGGLILCESSSPTIQDCRFYRGTASSQGGGVHCRNADPGITQCDFEQCTAHEGGAIACSEASAPHVSWSTLFWTWAHTGAAFYVGSCSDPLFSNCTVYRSCAADYVVYIDHSSAATLDKCILTMNLSDLGTELFFCGGGAFLSCCNIVANGGGDMNWTSCIADQYGVNGNFMACPSFCYFFGELGVRSLCDESPCLPGNHPHGYDCGVVGASVEGCSCGPSETEPSTWGAIKSMYR